ncbi:DNA replication and repair protein RadC [Thermoplasmatales archaeon SCGC AB-539-N05]|nr:DNA replication and repair protein RadC [Thermoplasmatales archaeon SCGC AB-539-N05]
MKIKEIPWYNRPGIRLKKKGVGSLSDAELLAVVLGRGNTEENAVDISNRVLKSFNFDKLSILSFHELKGEFKNQVPAMKILAMFEIFRRANRLMSKGFKVKIKSAEDVYNYFKDELVVKNKEHFYALFLDTKNRIIGEELISVGTLNSSLIHPREVFNPAIKASANSIILVHNHPSGDNSPSNEDEEVTKIIKDAGDILGIKVLDHIIIGKENYFSLKNK